MTKITIIAGPTASGKSALALARAEERNGVIINADSQQMYAELRLLTARPTPEEEARAPHRLYGTLSAAENCSAGKWLQYAKMEIDWALSEGRHPIVVGGTGLYLKSLTQGIAEIPPIDPMVRAQAISDYEAMGKEAFAERLKAADPAFFERLKMADKQRLIRAYEVWLGTGKPLSRWQAQQTMPLYPRDSFEVTVVELPREELYARCDARFVKMIKEGAVEEVKAVMGIGELGNWRIGEKEAIKSPVPQFSSSPILKVIGVRELAAYIRKEISLDEAIRQAQRATRNYAKRQLTWFRNQPL